MKACFYCCKRKRTGDWFCSTLSSLIFFTTTALLAINRYFVKEDKHQAEIYAALISKAKEFVRYTQSNRLVAELSQAQQSILEREGFKLNTKKVCLN